MKRVDPLGRVIPDRDLCTCTVMSNAHIHEWTVICPDCGLELVYAESVIVVLPKHQDIIKGKICGTAGRTIRTVLAPHAMASREAMTLS